MVVCWFFFQAEDGIRDLVRSRGLGDVYKRQFDSITVTSGRANIPGLGGMGRGRAAGRGGQGGQGLSLIHI